jgi:NAD(P)-dependent dehydrogenase (short-subunit alcohol dehydrogenase family)
MELPGKVALVTGGASGIGRAIVRAIAAAGARVVVADVDPDAGGSAAAEVDGTFVHTDVAQPEDLRRLVDTVVAIGGGLDVVVNNAGGVDAPVYPEAPLERWQRVLDVNLRATMLLTQLALEPLRRRRGGAIVNVASIGGLGAGPHPAPEYAAAKAGVVRWTATLAPLAEERIRVNAVCPDYVDTPLLRRTLAHLSKAQRAALPPLDPPERIADAVVGLIGDDTLAGRVLVCFTGGPTMFLPEGIPRSGA